MQHHRSAAVQSRMIPVETGRLVALAFWLLLVAAAGPSPAVAAQAVAARTLLTANAVSNDAATSSCFTSPTLPNPPGTGGASSTCCSRAIAGQMCVLTRGSKDRICITGQTPQSCFDPESTRGMLTLAFVFSCRCIDFVTAATARLKKFVRSTLTLFVSPTIRVLFL